MKNTSRALHERAAAVGILEDVTERRAYANIALRRVLQQYPDAHARSKAFVTELVNETLRNLIRIDHILNHFSQTPVAKMKPFIRALLRVSVCQLRFIARTPDAAAVNEAVALAKSRGFGPLSGFVNGVLRSIARKPDEPALPDFAVNPAAYLGLAYSYPPWLAESLTAQLGPDGARSFCENSHLTPSVTAFTNLTRLTPDALSQRLRREGAECASGLLHDECLHISRTSDIAALPSFNEGLFHVMDEGALIAVKALSPQRGMYVVDMCAAPGGKTFACACLMGGEGRVDAYDIHPHKVALMKETAARLGLTCVHAHLRDALLPPDNSDDDAADAVLLDAPCSGLGTIRKRPDIKYARTPEDIRTLADTQRKLLAAAAARVKPGGVLVYCTCTVTREENIDNIRWFTGAFPFTTQDLPADAWRVPPDGAHYFMEDRCLQLLPGPYNDGFFIARLIKHRDDATSADYSELN